MKKNRMNFYPSIVLLLAASACLLLSGCGGDKSYVTGTVTFDGQPASGCSMTFVSLEQGSGGSAKTDENGNYKAQMSLDNHWLAPGEYQVEIRGKADLLKADGLPEYVKPGDVSLPSKYRGEDTELTATAKPGSCTVDFELTSD